MTGRFGSTAASQQFITWVAAFGHERSFKEPVFKPLLKSAADLKAVSSEYFPELTKLTAEGSLIRR